MIIVWIVLAILIIRGIAALVRYYNSGTISNHHRTPLDIAKECYAMGEITKREFE